jgi:hypothetical protein
MGRKPKPAGENRENILRIRLTEAERQAIDEAAKEVFLETSTWARMELMKLAKQSGKRGNRTQTG